MLECPNCHSKAADDAPQEEVGQKFYKHRWEGYYTCLECSRRFSVQSNIVVS